MTKRALAFVILAACGGTSGSARVPGKGAGAIVDNTAGPPELELRAPPAKVGDLHAWTKQAHLEFTYQDGGTPKTLVVDREHGARMEYVEVEAGVPTSIGVVYGGQRNVEESDGAVTADDSPLAGKGYLLRRSHGELEGYTTDGHDATAAEVAYLRSHHARLGKPWTLIDLVGSRGWRIGEVVEISAADLARYVNSPDDPGSISERMTLTLESATDDRVTFTSEGVMRLEDPSGPTTLREVYTATFVLDRADLGNAEGHATGTLTGTLGGRPVTGTAEQLESLD